MTDDEIQKLLKKERYRYCHNPACRTRFKLGPDPEQKYCRASCYKAHRRQKTKRARS